MALSAVTTWEVRTGGSDTLCSGGFVTGASGTDYSQQNAAQYNNTDLVIDGAVNTKCTSATHNFVAADVGNILRVTAGTNFTVGFYQIVSVAANAATVDRSLGTLGSTGGTYYVGGAFASPGQAGAAKVAGNDVFIQSGTYTLGSATANIATGRVDDTTGGVSGANESWWVGYNTTRTVDNTDATKPTISAGAITAITILTGSGLYSNFRNVVVDCNSGATTTAISLTGGFGQVAQLCDVKNFTVYGIRMTATAPQYAIRCTATGGTSAATAGFSCNQSGDAFILCEAFANACHGFDNGGQINTFIGCVASGQTNSKLGFFDTGISGGIYYNCVAYGNAGGGFGAGNGGAPRAWLYVNCIAEGNTGEGFKSSGVSDGVQLLNCAGYNNSGGDYNVTNITHVAGFVANTTGSFFVNAASGNFALNSTANQGALARGTGVPGVMPRGLSTGYADIGTIQHQDPVSTGGAGPQIIISSGASSRSGSW